VNFWHLLAGILAGIILARLLTAYLGWRAVRSFERRRLAAADKLPLELLARLGIDERDSLTLEETASLVDEVIAWRDAHELPDPSSAERPPLRIVQGDQ
jgi:hypothetical protein